MSPSTSPAPSMLDALADVAERGAERAIARLLPHLVEPRDPWTTPGNARALFAKSWRAIDEWAARRGVQRFEWLRSPRYRTSDLDAAIVAEVPSVRVATNDADESLDAMGAKLARATKARRARTESGTR